MKGGREGGERKREGVRGEGKGREGGREEERRKGKHHCVKVYMKTFTLMYLGT